MNKELIKKTAKDNNIKVIIRDNGHVTLTGKLSVAYYPTSKNKTAYIKGTTKAYKNVSLTEAIKMCNIQPKGNGKKNKRSKNYKQIRKEIFFSGFKNCHWCKLEMTLESCTLEHIIPLHIGGLNNRNNMTLACSTCNNLRGCNMPELSE
jgi:hypothetical protein